MAQWQWLKNNLALIRAISAYVLYSTYTATPICCHILHRASLISFRNWSLPSKLTQEPKNAMRLRKTKVGLQKGPPGWGLTLIYVAVGLCDLHSFELPLQLEFLCKQIVKQFVFLVQSNVFQQLFLNLWKNNAFISF